MRLPTAHYWLTQCFQWFSRTWWWWIAGTYYTCSRLLNQLGTKHHTGHQRTETKPGVNSTDPNTLQYRNCLLWLQEKFSVCSHSKEGLYLEVKETFIRESHVQMAVHVLEPGRQLLGHWLWDFCEFGLTALVFGGWSYEHLNETGFVAP